MTHNNSFAATEDIRAYLDRALEATKGIRVRVGDKAAATKLRHRIYSVRAADRKANTQIYGVSSPQAGKSVYDALTVDIDENHHLLIQKFSGLTKEIEEL